MPTSGCGIGGDQVGDPGVERFDMPIDLVKPLPTRALEQSDGEVFLAVLERGPIPHQTVAGIDQFGELHLLGALHRSDRRLQGGSHAGQQHGVDAIGLGKSADRLCEAPGTHRIEYYARPISQGYLQRPAIERGAVVGENAGT